jgi:hypothetical protein
VILSDLLRDAEKAGDEAGAFRVLIATRIVDGVEMEAGRVQVSEAGFPQVDLSGGEIDILPTRFMDPPGPCLTVAAFRQLALEQPDVVDFTLTAVTRFKRLGDGGNVQKTDQAMGTNVLAQEGEIWLLLYPESQWPAHWFGA